MKKLGIKTVALDLEVQYARKHENKNVSKHIFLLIDYFEKMAKELDIKVLIYSFISYVIKNRSIPKSKLIHSKFLYVWYLSMQTEKDKNIIYKR